MDKADCQATVDIAEMLARQEYQDSVDSVGLADSVELAQVDFQVIQAIQVTVAHKVSHQVILNIMLTQIQLQDIQAMAQLAGIMQLKQVQL